jgi:hypothetical protein
LQTNTVSDKRTVMPYTLKLYIYLFVVNVLVVIVAGRWRSSYDCSRDLRGCVRLFGHCLGALVVWTEKSLGAERRVATAGLKAFGNESI